MCGKGIRYWNSVWNEQYDDSDRGRAYRADRVLKRYAYLFGTTYGNDVWHIYYATKWPMNMPKGYNHSSSIDEAVARLQHALEGKPIKEGGDLYQILQVFAEKNDQPKNYYLQHFNIKPNVFLSFFSSNQIKQTSYIELKQHSL